MPADDYWEDDELQDRLYHAREQEKRAERQNIHHGGVHWPIRRLRSISIIACFMLMILWWSTSSGQSTTVHWSHFAYSQYATDTHSLCNSLMVFESLHRLNSKADRVLLYPAEWSEDSNDINGRLMQTASRKFGVKLIPVELLDSDGEPQKPGTLDDPNGDWDLSVTKLRVFELTQYDRVLHLDSDITLLQHMDELFSLPKAPIAMPRAYWSDGPHSTWQLTSLIMLVEPNAYETAAMRKTLRKWQSQPDYAKSKKYDMDLLNHRFGASAMVLPHRPYAMLTAEFRSQDHQTYMGSQNAAEFDSRSTWDAEKALKEAKLVHFSDWPLPKPWIMWPNDGLAEMQPGCEAVGGRMCKEREIWRSLYEDFRRKRKDICKILPVPAPNWAEWKKDTGAGG